MACREHLARLRERGDEIEQLGAEVLVVTFEPPARATRFARDEAIPFPVLSDPSRRAYTAFGLKRGSVGRLWSWNAVKTYLRGAVRGRWPRLPQSDVTQLGGDFVIDREGQIVFAHRSDEAADRPRMDELLGAVRLAGGSERKGC